ncbi:MAG: flagellar hook-length control protein FliK [Rhodoferax sp.]|jgi:flagellar hook-length control protein FliK
MSIERSNTPASSKLVLAAEGNNKVKEKNRDQAADRADGADAGGFASVLTSLAPPRESKAESQKEPKTQTQTQTPATGAVAVSKVVDVSRAQDDVTKVDAEAPTILVNPSLMAVITIPADTPSIALAAAFGSAPPNRTTTAVGVKSDKAEVLLAKPSALAVNAGQALDLRQSVAALLEQSAQVLSAQTASAKTADLQSGAGAILAESRALKQITFLDTAAREPMLSGALMTSGLGESFFRTSDRSLSKSQALSSGYGAEGTSGQSALMAGNRLETSAVMVDPSAPTFETALADNVSYWVAQGVQKAELKLDGFGGEPVQVSISLKGDMAHIGFRTDQPEVRQLLESAVTQLKEMLTSEGLVLSGVSVGASGQGGAGEQTPRERQGVRQGNVVSAELAPTETVRRGSPLAVGRSLDLFV